jgi:hypothetical protein
VNDAEFFSEMVARFVEKTADGAEDRRPASKAKAKDKRGLNPVLAYIAPMGAHAFDAYSTTKALKAGGREGNPVLAPFANNEAALYISKMGAGLLIGFAADKLAKSGHRDAAKVISAISITIPLGAGINNMAKAKK